MIYTVVPVKNEENKIGKTLSMLSNTKTDKILVVLNGCEDRSMEEASKIQNDRIEFLYFNKPLGIDVPRAVGAYHGLRADVEGIIFVDGDMCGHIGPHIDLLIEGILERKLDMALSDCYNHQQATSTMAKILLSFRKQLNIELGIYTKIQTAIPSHGPHGVSRRLLDKIPLQELAIPPVSLALAAKYKLNIDVVTSIPSDLLDSTIRDEYHANQIAKTMIGDCIEAIQVYRDEDRTRGYDGFTFTGYHKNRRFDLVKAYMEFDTPTAKAVGFLSG
ncbi:MAG: glycosyltransferase family A protein [Bacillota bacterium]